MIRVLQLIPTGADLQTRVSVRAIREHIGDGFEITVRKVHSMLPAIRLRRERERYDIVHAWDSRSLRVAQLAGFPRVLFTHRQQIFSPGRSPETIYPPLDVDDEADHTNRSALREQLGLHDDHFVLLAAGESTRAAAHERAVWTGSILHVTDERYRMLLWGRGPRLDVAADLGDKLRQANLVVVAERALGRSIEFDELLPAADALLVTALKPSPVLPVAMAMAAGIPVVACERPEFAKLLIDGETNFNVPACEVRPLAQRILDLRDDPKIATAIKSRARECVRQIFSPDKFLAKYRQLYGGQLTSVTL